jgi:site-specific DNA-methyltransferase (adenine-specific)
MSIQNSLTPYFSTELGKLYNCDFKELLKSLKDDSIDLVFTSPPYNMGVSNTYKEYKDNLSNEDYYFLLKTLIEESLRICNGLIFINLNYTNNNKKVLYRILYEYCEYLRESIIWDKGNCEPPAGNILGKRYEYVFMFTKNNKIEINNFRENKAKNYQKVFGNWISNVVRLSTKSDQTSYSKINRAGFPLELPRVFIDIYTKSGDIILDPFMGVGTTAIVSERMNRKWVGSDISKSCCITAKSLIGGIALQI